MSLLFRVPAAHPIAEGLRGPHLRGIAEVKDLKKTRSWSVDHR